MIARIREQRLGFVSVALLLLLLPFSATAQKTKKNVTETRAPMPHHSFASPMAYRDLLDYWSVSGASIFEPERLLLHPAVSQRHGLLWSKKPVLTSSFEIIVQFKVQGEKVPTAFAPDQSFAVWYVEENMASSFNEKAFITADSWSKALEDGGYTLSGAKGKFKGFGVVLSMADVEKTQKPVVTLITNDLTKSMAFGADVPTAASKAIDFRNTINSAQLKIRVTPENIEGYLKQSPSLSWQECFNIDRANGAGPWAGPNGYVGITAWSGSTGEPDLVSISQLDATNLDENSIGEEMDVSTKIQDAYREMLTDDKRHFIDQKSQMDHLQRLTQLLSDHVKESEPAERKLYEDMKDLEKRMSALDEDCRTLSKEFSILVNPAGGSGAGAVKNEIIGLRALLEKDSHSHRKKIEAVQENVKAVKTDSENSKSGEAFTAIGKQSETLERSVKARGTQMSGMLFALIGCVLIIGGLMFNRMRYYEKKHFI